MTTSNMNQIIENQIALLYDAYEALDIDYTLGTYQGESFLIVSSHSDIEKIEDYLKENEHKSLLINYGFDDEYTTCSECYKIIRTSPDCYSWTPNYHISDGSILCHDCIDIEYYINDFINDCNKAVSNEILTDEILTSNGFIKMNSEPYENGLHAGMNDKPIDIFNQFKTESNDIIFKYESSQFYITFDVWVRENNDIFEEYEDDMSDYESNLFCDNTGYCQGSSC